MNREKLESYLEKNPFAKLSDVVTQILYDEIVVLDIPPTSKLNINQIATDPVSYTHLLVRMAPSLRRPKCSFVMMSRQPVTVQKMSPTLAASRMGMTS